MPTRLVTLMAIATLAISTAGCGSGSPALPEQSTRSSATSSVPKAVPGGSIAVYTSTELGSSESFSELKDVKEAGFDAVIAYGSMNGRSIRAIQQYLDAAQNMGIGVVFSVKDLLGVTDADETNAEHHRAMFGTSTDRSNDAQVMTIVKELVGHPAVQSVLITDEQPGNTDDLEEWLPRLKKRYNQIHKVKPVTAVFYWNSTPDFYRKVGQYTDEVQIDYYPLPENPGYGPLDRIADIGDMLGRTAGTSGRFVVQAFGWDPVSHPEGKRLGFDQASPAPTTAQMVDMAKRAVVGRGNGGATNLAFYAMGEPNAASLQSMKEAVKQIRQSTWWQQRGN